MDLDTEVAPATANPEPMAETPAAPAEDSGHWEDQNDRDLKDIFAKHNPARDDAGRFQSRATPTETEVLPDQPEAESKETVVPSIPAPQSWSADVKEKWATLPPDVQTYIAKRESEAHEAITRQGKDLKAYEPLRSVVDQNRDIFERNGVTADDGISRLLAAERLLEQNPVAAINQLARAYGVDLTQFAGHENAGSAETALHQRIAFLESQLTDTSNRISERERREAQTQQQSMTSLIDSFAKDKSDWAELENDILTEITGIRAAISEKLIPELSPDQLLAKAYERAQRNNPTVFAKKQEAERKAEAEKRKAEEALRIAEAKKRAEAAKTSNSVNIRSTPANGRTISTIDDDLRAVFRKNHAT